MAEEDFVAGPFEADPEMLVQRARDTLADRFPNITLAPGSLLEWDVETDAQTAADVAQLALTVAEEIVIDVLTRLLQEPRRLATPATGTATLLVSGATAVTVPDGTILEGIGPDGEPVSIQTLGAHAASIGTTEITGVPVQTLQVGTAVNGTSGDLLGLEQFPFGVAAELDGPLAGALEEEDRYAHLGRLVRLARIMAPRPIAAADIAEFVALKVPGVEAALCLENTDPGPPLDTVAAGHFTVGIRAADGTAPPGPVVAAAQALLDAALTSTIEAHVVTADYTTVNVAATVLAWPGYDHDVIAALAQDVVTSYLSPARWGEPPRPGEEGGDSPPRWAQTTGVYIAEVIERLGTVTGVDRARTSVTINGVNADLELEGLLPLPLPGTVTITVLDR
ncbi:unannotated protein [freshwater metagenome]|uniref:Unannotated protein n=1 Tax=freshwater metagenome TaxID=449393 RepID=A0A6J7FHL4_9ZZZZ|nr:hypothetical protein [Actinomycetota bacterium]